VIPETIEDLERAPLKYLGPIDELEAAFIEHHDDLIAVQPKSRSWFRNVLERSLILKFPVIRPLFERQPEEIKAINTNTQTIWQNDKRVEGLSGTIVALVGLGMLLGPLWVLEVFNNSPSNVTRHNYGIHRVILCVGIGGDHCADIRRSSCGCCIRGRADGVLEYAALFNNG